jgi:hypothetical protein
VAPGEALGDCKHLTFVDTAMDSGAPRGDTDHANCARAKIIKRRQHHHRLAAQRRQNQRCGAGSPV